MHHIAFSLSQAVFHQAVERLDERGIEHSGVKDRGFMDSIYFEDPLGLPIELASYRFEPPTGFTHSDVLLEAHKIRVERGDYNIDQVHLADAIELLVRRSRESLSDERANVQEPLPGSGGDMAAMKLHVLKPSVNNLTVRIFVRAAGLDFEEVDVWGKTDVARVPREEPGAPDADDRGGRAAAAPLWESCAIMQYLCNKHDLDQFYPTDPAQRAMVDSAMFYLIGTLYPLVARATYPALSFPQYPGEVGTSDADDAMKAQGTAGRHGGDRRAARRLPRVLPRRQAVHRRRHALDRRHPPGRDARVPAGHRLRPPGLGERVHGRDGVGARRGLLRAGGRRARLHRVREVAGLSLAVRG